MRRIMIIGGPGSGKSTLARQIGARCGLPVVHIDQLFWRPGWVEGDREALAAELRRLYARDAWVIEGNYARTWPERVARADMLVFLDLPSWLRFLRVVRRLIAHHGRVRPDLAEGCPERFDARFLFGWVLRYRRGKRRDAVALLRACRSQLRCHHLTSAGAVRRFLAAL